MFATLETAPDLDLGQSDLDRLLHGDVVLRRHEQLIGNSTDILCCLPADVDALHMIVDAVARGAIVRAIVPNAVWEDPDFLDHVEPFVRQGGQLHTSAGPIREMIIVDRRVALIPIDPTDPAGGMLRVEGAGVAQCLATSFDLAWDNTAELSGVRRDLTALERDLLGLLAKGGTDDVVAARMHVSPRTVRRMLATIMVRLQARSRFEAGAKAVARGWL